MDMRSKTLTCHLHPVVSFALILANSRIVIGSYSRKYDFIRLKISKAAYIPSNYRLTSIL